MFRFIFFNKYKRKYKIISFPYRLEQINKLQEWIKKKNFIILSILQQLHLKKKKIYNKIDLVNKKLPIKIIKLLQKNFKKRI